MLERVRCCRGWGSSSSHGGLVRAQADQCAVSLLRRSATSRADFSTRNCRKIFDGLADRFKGTIAGEVGAPFVPTLSDASVLLWHACCQIDHSMMP